MNKKKTNFLMISLVHARKPKFRHVPEKHERFEMNFEPNREVSRFFYAFERYSIVHWHEVTV